MPEPQKRHPVEDRARIVEELRRRSLAEDRSVKSLVAEYGISEATYQNWRRAKDDAERYPSFRPVEVTALVPALAPAVSATLTLVSKSGHRVEGLTVEQAGQILRVLESPPC